MLAQDVQQIQQVWPYVAKVVFVPHTEAEYDQLVAALDYFIDTVGEDESHPLAPVMEIIGVLVEKYEDEHISEITDI